MKFRLFNFGGSNVPPDELTCVEVGHAFASDYHAGPNGGAYAVVEQSLKSRIFLHHEHES